MSKKRKKRNLSAAALMGGLGRNFARRTGGGAHKHPTAKREKNRLRKQVDDERP